MNHKLQQRKVQQQLLYKLIEQNSLSSYNTRVQSLRDSDT
jgi:hypothetical protein